MRESRLSKGWIMVLGLVVAVAFGAPAGTQASNVLDHHAASTPDAGASSTLFAKHRRWPRQVIRYHLQYRQIGHLVRRATKLWNESGAKVRWRPVPARQAEVTIKRVAMDKFLGWAGQLYKPETRTKFRPGVRGGSIIKIDPEILRFERSKGPSGLPTEDHFKALQFMVHEMGHIMGLAHTNGCAVMNAGLLHECPPPPRPDLYRCRPLETDDIRGAVRLFGGKPRIPSGWPWCKVDVPPPPDPVTDLSVVYTPDHPVVGRSLRVRWRMPVKNGPARVAVKIGAEGICPDSPAGARWSGTRRIKPGAWSESWLTAVPPVGDYCARVFAANAKGVIAPGVVTAEFSVPE